MAMRYSDIVALAIVLTGVAPGVAQQPREALLPPSAPAPWTTVAGNIVTIARAGLGLGQPIYRALMVCNSNGPDTTTAIIFKKTDGHPEGVDVAEPEIEKGKCLLVDQPTGLFVTDRVQHPPPNGEPDNSGFYQTFPQGTFNLGANEPYRIVDQPPEPGHATPASPAPVPVECVPLTDANPVQNIFATCEIRKLVKEGSYRICFGAMYTPPMPNGDPYAGTLLPMVTDPKLIAQPFQGTPNEALFNYVMPGGCRDIYHIGSAKALNFIVWPYMHIAGSIWDPALVTKITLTIDTLF